MSVGKDSFTPTDRANESPNPQAKGSDKDDDDKPLEEEKKSEDLFDTSKMTSKERKRAAALDNLTAQDIIVTYEAKKGKLHENTRDINVSGVTVTFHSRPLIEDTEVVINYGNRYGLIGPNGSGKVSVNSTFLEHWGHRICS